MSVKIEILDYVYGEVEGTQMISNYSFTSSADWNTGNGWSIAGGAATHSGSSGYLQNTNVTFIEGQNYRIKYKISGRTAGSLILANHLPSNANGFNQNGNGSFSYDWIQGSNNNNKLSLYGSTNFDGSVEYAEVYLITNIDWEKSVVGELDITDHSDFPLAMTFQISDFKDLTSTTGDYSKTFKIPATKNNNKIFKHLYNPNSISENKITDKKNCRILVNNLYSLVGLLKVNAVGGYGETPSYYDCVFFGSNLGWGAVLQDNYMDAIDWGNDSKNLTYNKASIMATWQHADCDDASSASDAPIVYPVTSYGVYNEGGKARTIQLLDTFADAWPTTATKVGYYGFNDSGSSYETPKPSADWRPSVFVKSTLEKIFNGVGYKISSTFMDTDMFKKLVWLLPNFKYNNPDERYSKYSAEATFDTSVALSEFEIESYWAYSTSVSASFGLQYSSHNVDFGTINTNFTLSSETASTDITYIGGAEGFQIAEYGYYNLKASGFSAELSNLLQDGAVPADDINNNSRRVELSIDRIQFRLQVKTVGQNSWNDIDYIENTTFRNFKGSPNASGVSGGGSLIDATNSYDWNVSGGINLEEYWLNKGDRIRIAFFAKFKPHNNVGPWKGDGDWSFDVIPTIREFDISLKPEKVEYGQTYDLDKVMNKDYKQTDFVKGIAHAFNLQMTTDESTRTVNIEPFNSFYKPFGSAIDWTYKLDRSKEISDKWLENDLKRTLVFKYKSDGKDAKVKIRGEKYFFGIEDEWPYREILPDTFDKGDSTFENPFFAGTYNAKDYDTTQIFFGSNSSANDTAFSACLWTENVSSNDESRPNKGYEFLPRLLYWNKYSPNPSNSNSKRARVQTWSSTTKVVSAGVTGSSGLLSDIYPQATMINEDSTTSPVLSYGNIYVRDYDDVNKTYSSYVVGKGLYDTYYKDSIEMLKENPRMRTSYIALKISDIVNLDFTKLVYIDGVYWRINKIIDFMPNKNESTKVELIQFTQQSAFSGSAPMINSSGGLDNWQDIIADDDFDLDL